MDLIYKGEIVNKLLRRSTLALACMVASSVAFAATYTESGDAGQTLATAQAVAPGTTQINGGLGFSGDVDLYRLDFSTSTTVTFHATSAGDPNLILFDAAGHGLWGDDDGGGGLASQIVWNVTPGTYYLAYGQNNIYGMDASNNMFCGDDTGDCSADTTSVLDHFDSIGTFTGPYTITLSAATAGAAAPTSIPTLSEWGMILLSSLLALGTIFTLRRKRQ
jgi:hypothetical protein